MHEQNDGLDNAAQVRRYFAAVNGGDSDASLALLHPEVVQEEYPNRLLPDGATRDLAALREAAARGRALLASQHFDARALYSSGSTVIVESIWTGTVKIDVGPFKAGTYASAYGIDTPPDQLVTSGAWRLKQYAPGEKTVLEPNPYWFGVDQHNQRLPYLDRKSTRLNSSHRT